MIWPPDSPWAPWWRTSKRTAEILCDIAAIKNNDFIIDLGCGEATALVIAARKHGAKGIGIEIDPLRYLQSIMNVYFNRVPGKIRIVRGNFFNQELSQASVIFVYLIPKTLQELKKKFLKELKPKTRIVSFRYQMDLPLIKKDEKEKIYIYEIPRNT